MSLLASNLLSRAQRLIPPVDIVRYAWASNTDGGAGVLIPTYAAAATIKASVQAVSRAMYEKFGLDFQKSYLMVYCSTPLQDVARGTGGVDVVDFAGRRYSVESNTDWYALNGWRGSICVDIGAAGAAP